MNELIHSIANIVLFSLIPFIWYVVTTKTYKGFFKNTGLYWSKDINKKVLPLLMITLVYALCLTLYSIFFSGREFQVSSELATPIAILWSLFLHGINTGIPEEIFFRGFIAKKAINKLGFSKGNLLQAAIFSLPHLMVVSHLSAIDMIIAILNALFLGWVLGYIMNKVSKGSIALCIIIHMAYNIFSNLIPFLLLV